MTRKILHLANFCLRENNANFEKKVMSAKNVVDALKMLTRMLMMRNDVVIFENGGNCRLTGRHKLIDKLTNHLCSYQAIT